MNTHAYTPMHIQNLINRTAMEANILPLNCYTIIITIIYRRFFMSHKTVICFAIWTSFWSALFNHFYTVYFGSFGVPWIMFDVDVHGDGCTNEDGHKACHFS